MSEKEEKIYQVHSEGHPPLVVFADGHSFAAYRYYNHELENQRPIKPFDCVSVTELSGKITDSKASPLPFSTKKSFLLDEDTSFTPYPGNQSGGTVCGCPLLPTGQLDDWLLYIHFPINRILPKYQEIRFDEECGVKFGLTESEVYSTYGTNPATARLFSCWVEIIHNDVINLKKSMRNAVSDFTKEELFKFVGLRNPVLKEADEIVKQMLENKINDEYFFGKGKRFFKEVSLVISWREYKELSVHHKNWVAESLGLSANSLDEKTFFSIEDQDLLISTVYNAKAIPLEQAMKESLPF